MTGNSNRIKQFQSNNSWSYVIFKLHTHAHTHTKQTNQVILKFQVFSIEETSESANKRIHSACMGIAVDDIMQCPLPNIDITAPIFETNYGKIEENQKL